MSLEIDYSPRTLWGLQRGEHLMEARLMPHAQSIAVVILVDGHLRAAQAFDTRPMRCPPEVLACALDGRIPHRLRLHLINLPDWRVAPAIR